MRRPIRTGIALALLSLAQGFAAYALPADEYPGLRQGAAVGAVLFALAAIVVMVWPLLQRPKVEHDTHALAVQRIAIQRERGLQPRSRLIALGDYARARPLYDAWYDETVKVLQHRALNYVAEFNGGSWSAADILGITDPELNDLILRLDWRLGRLGVIIGYLSAQSSSPAISEGDQT